MNALFLLKKRRISPLLSRTQKENRMKLVIATKNKGKIWEIRDILSNCGDIEILSSGDLIDPPVVIEDGETFEDNARKKAIALSRHAKLPALADDSGLVVDALGGKPGVYSARYGGEGLGDAERNALLLKHMEKIPDGKRTARFVCVIALAMPGGDVHIAHGSVEGEISREPRGSGGFGYDPVFLIPELGKTMAELPMAEKNEISHRARALKEAKRILKDILNRA